jgi:small subunit ribosomal protein S5
MREPREIKEFEEKVVRISRVSKKTKGGNKVGFTALVVVGDRKGRVGVALGKANNVLSAIKKGIRKSKKRLVSIPLVDGRTIPHMLMTKFGASKIIMKPAPAGTGVIAGGSVRSVLELAGVKDVVAKTLGTSNKLTNVTATFNALKTMKSTVDTKTALGQKTVTFGRRAPASMERKSAVQEAPKKDEKDDKKDMKQIAAAVAKKSVTPAKKAKAKKETK